MNRWKRLTETQLTFLLIAVALVFAGMVIGFWSSWGNLYAAAQAHGWQYPWHLPAGADVGIVAYVLLDQIAVMFGAKSRWLHVVAWGFAAFSVWANWAVTDGPVTWRVIYAAMPAVWVIGVEALRWFWRMLAKDPDAAKRDRVPASRWLANPFTAARLQRRMWMLNERSWPRMAAIEDARLLARDLVHAALRDSDAKPPSMLTKRIDTGRLPGAILLAVDADLAGGTATSEAAVHGWVKSQMLLPDVVAADLQAARYEIAQTVPEAAVETPPGRAAESPPERAESGRPKSAPTPARKGARRLSEADRIAKVRALLQADPDTSEGAVMRECGVGRPTAKALLAEAKKIRAVV